MLSRKSSLIVLQNIINSSAGLIGMIFLTRFYSLGWSILSFGLGFAGLFTLVLDLGFSTANVKLQSQGGDEGEYNYTFLLTKLLFGLLYGFLSVSALLVWVFVLKRGFEFQAEFWVVIAIIPYYFFSGMLGFTTSYFQAKLKPSNYVIPSIVEAVVRNSIFAGLGIIAILHIGKYSEAEMSIVLAVVYSLTYGMYFFLTFIFGMPWKFTRFSLVTFRKYMAIAIPLALASVVGAIGGNIDKVIIQFYWAAEATGSFYLYQRLALVLTSFSGSVTFFLLPMLARLHNERPDDMRSSVKDYERIVTLFSLGLAVMFIMLPLYIINLFSSFFTGYSSTLSILAFNAVMQLNYYPFMNALIARGKQKVVGTFTAIGIIANIVVDVITIPPKIFGVSFLSLGVMGGAVGTLSASFIINISFRYYLSKSGVKASNGKIFKLVVPAMVQAAFLYVTASRLHPFHAIILIPLALASLVIYALVAIAVRELSFMEVKEFLTGINPLRLIHSLKEDNP